jgi:hypothetical protein
MGAADGIFLFAVTVFFNPFCGERRVSGVIVTLQQI